MSNLPHWAFALSALALTINIVNAVAYCILERRQRVLMEEMKKSNKEDHSKTMSGIKTRTKRPLSETKKS